MIRMNSLANVERDVADLVVRAELAGAGIPAFETISATRFHRRTVQGLLQFEDGQAATFSRGDNRYHVGLHKPMPMDPAKKFETRRAHDSEISAKELIFADEKKSALAFDLMSSLAVEEFVNLLIELHGKPVFNARKGPEGSVAFFLPEAREFLPAPSGDRETARLDIRALLALSRCRDSDAVALELMESALWEALVHFGDRSRKAMEIRASLARCYGHHIHAMQLQLTCGSVPAESQVNDLVESVERCQMRYIRTLRSLGRHKQARSEEGKLPAMRQAVEKALFEQLNDLVAEIRRLDTDIHHGPGFLQPRYALRQSLIESMAFKMIRLADVYRASGREDEATRLEQGNWMPAIVLGISQRLASAIQMAQMVSIPPHRYEELLLAAREGQRASRRRAKAAQKQPV